METKTESEESITEGVLSTNAEEALPENAESKATEERQPHEADYGGEMFDVVNENNEVIGTETRKKCHEEGILHRSTHVFVFRHHQPIGRARPRVEMLVQKRSEKKTVGPGLWDVSVAEHLSVGEDYVKASIRGLEEEIGLKNVSESDLLRIRESYLSRQLYQDVNVLDHMFTQTFALLYNPLQHGHITIDEEEVESVEWWDVRDLVVKGKADKDETEFTRWLLIELRSLDLMVIGNMITGTM